MNAVKLSELIEILELDSDEASDYVDLQTGRVVRVWSSLMEAVKEGNEEAMEGMQDWEKEEIEAAKAIAADSGERFVNAPGKFDFHEYRQMERFIGTVEDRAAADQLSRAIEGKGAFRYFKDSLNPDSEMKRTRRRSQGTGARRSRRFSVRKVWCVCETWARWTLKRPEGRAPAAARNSISEFGLNGLGLSKQWYEHRDEAIKEFIREWAEANHVPLVDDTRPGC